MGYFLKELLNKIFISFLYEGVGTRGLGKLNLYSLIYWYSFISLVLHRTKSYLNTQMGDPVDDTMINAF